MKKLIVFLLALSIIPSFSHAETLMGFMDGKLYDSTGSLKYICFMDDECINKDNLVTTRQALGISKPIVIQEPQKPIEHPNLTQQPVYYPTPSIATSIPDTLVSGTGSTFDQLRSCVASDTVSCFDSYMVDLAEKFCRPVWLGINLDEPADKDYCKIYPPVISTSSTTPIR